MTVLMKVPVSDQDGRRLSWLKRMGGHPEADRGGAKANVRWIGA
jgi:hypothetical protein